MPPHQPRWLPPKEPVAVARWSDEQMEDFRKYVAIIQREVEIAMKEQRAKHLNLPTLGRQE